MKDLFYGLWPICCKEFTHIRRDPTTLFFTLAVPLMQLFLLGLAVDTNVRQIATVVLDESHTQQSRQFIDKLAASDSFHIVAHVDSADKLDSAIRAGEARVGVRIPSGRRLLAARPADRPRGDPIDRRDRCGSHGGRRRS